jgi:hypothetical protein
VGAEPLEPTQQDEADLAVLRAESENPDERVITLEQPIGAVDEVMGGGNGIVAHLGYMLKSLGEHLDEADLMADFAHFSVYGVRSTEPAIEASTRNIIPIGTLKLIMSIRVKPADR